MIRDATRIRQESLDFDEKWLVVDVKLRSAVSGLPDHALAVCDPSRPITVIPMPGRRFRFELMLLPGEDPAEIQRSARVQELIARWVPIGAAEIERAAIYEFHGVVAQVWRRGRALLAGDAAHLMPPLLGRGMTSGSR